MALVLLAFGVSPRSARALEADAGPAAASFVSTLGVGVKGLLVPVDHSGWQKLSQASGGAGRSYDRFDLAMEVTGGGAIFGEWRALDRLAVLLEIGVLLPKARAVTSGEDVRDDYRFLRDVFATALLLARVPFDVGVRVSVYPLVGAGYGLYVARELDSYSWTYAALGVNERFTLHGVAFQAGLGAEIALSDRFAMALEAGYRGWVGWCRRSTEWDLRADFHALVLSLGLRVDWRLPRD